MSFKHLLQERLYQIEKADRLRTLTILQSGPGPYVNIDGRKMLNLSSNDYLGLGMDQRVINATTAAASKWGGSAGASRLISGNLEIHEELEHACAKLVGMETALAFSSGYAANTGLIAALSESEDVVFSDSLNHASIIDGCRLSRARTMIYRHCDVDDLASKLKENRSEFKRAFIVTESLFSMDGDLAPLNALADLAEEYDAWLIVDEAHALGVIGDGRGGCAQAGVIDKVSAIIGTFGKALGSQGAFIAGKKPLRSYLLNKTRSFIFSTALAPACCGAALAAIEIVMAEGKEHSSVLLEKSAQFKTALKTENLSVIPGAFAQIQPVILGSEKDAMETAGRLYEAGIFARAIRPPTVPDNACRIRFTINLGHQLDELVSAAKSCAG